MVKSRRCHHTCEGFGVSDDQKKIGMTILLSLKICVGGSFNPTRVKCLVGRIAVQFVF